MRSVESRLRTLKARQNVVEEELHELDEQMQASNEDVSNPQLERALEDETELERGVRLGQLTPFAGSRLARSRLTQKKLTQSSTSSSSKRIKSPSIKRSDSNQNSKTSNSINTIGKLIDFGVYLIYNALSIFF